MFNLFRKIRPACVIENVFSGKCVSILREFKKPPYGGGNQFMLALKKGFEDMGIKVVNNKVSSQSIDAYIFDSSWLDKDLFQKLAKLDNPRVAHRIDGPIQLYRGTDSSADDEIFELNNKFATTTIIQSNFTLQKLYELNYKPVKPVIIHNAVNPDIFYPKKDLKRSSQKIKIVSASWSDNPRKGGVVYKWLDESLDFSTIEYSFIGRIKEDLKNIKIIPPVPSEQLAEILRSHDIYITASENDPCSNSLIEALACGLPVIYKNSGGHPELVREAGLSFNTPDEISTHIKAILSEYEKFRSSIHINTITDTAQQYLHAIFQES